MDYQISLKKAIAKRKLLECQYEKAKMRGFPKVTCRKCKDRFTCLTMRAKKFRVTEVGTYWDAYEVYAENSSEADGMFRDFCGEDELIGEPDKGNEMENLEIEQETKDGRWKQVE